MKCRSLWYVAPETVVVREIELPALGPDDCLVRVEACGVCTWDLFIFGGGFQEEKPYPFYFGHEGVGYVEETGSKVTALARGQRVALRETSDIGRLGQGHMADFAVLPQRCTIDCQGGAGVMPHAVLVLMYAPVGRFRAHAGPSRVAS